MSVTYSGIQVTPENDACLSWEDIIRGLSRQPRFGGQCRWDWTVLDHSLVCWHLVEPYAANSELQLHVLLHDAHEALLGDVPSPWKTPDRKQLEHQMNLRIWKQAGLKEPTAIQQAVIDLADTIALVAEARLVGPPKLASYPWFTGQARNEKAEDLVFSVFVRNLYANKAEFRQTLARLLADVAI